MIGVPTILSLAIKYANTLGRIHLVERLSELEPRLKEQEEKQKEYDRNENANDLVLNTSNVSSLLGAKQTPNSTPIAAPVSIIEASH